MSFDSLLRHELVVKRMAGDGGVDERGQPIIAPVTVAKVPGLIQPRAVREMALASQAGVPVGDHVAFLRPLDSLGSDCWIEFAGGRYDIVGVQDAAGQGHHFEIDLRRVA